MRCGGYKSGVRNSWARAKVHFWAVDDVLGLHVVKIFCDSEIAAGTLDTSHLQMKNLNPSVITFVRLLTDGYISFFFEFRGKRKADASRDALVLVLGRLYALGGRVGPPAPCVEPRPLV